MLGSYLVYMYNLLQIFFPNLIKILIVLTKLTATEPLLKSKETALKRDGAWSYLQ